jgi:hypothetical protein
MISLSFWSVGTRDLGWFGLSFGAIQQLIVTIITRHLNMLSGLGRGVRVGGFARAATPRHRNRLTGANRRMTAGRTGVLMPCEFYRKTRTYRQVFGIMDAALNGDSRPCSQRNYWYHSHYRCGPLSRRSYLEQTLQLEARTIHSYEPILDRISGIQRRLYLRTT